MGKAVRLVDGLTRELPGPDGLLSSSGADRFETALERSDARPSGTGLTGVMGRSGLFRSRLTGFRGLLTGYRGDPGTHRPGVTRRSSAATSGSGRRGSG